MSVLSPWWHRQISDDCLGMGEALSGSWGS